MIAVQSMVVPPDEHAWTLVKFAALCRKRGRMPLCARTLNRLIDGELSAETYELRALPRDPLVGHGIAKYLWATARPREAQALVRELVRTRDGEIGDELRLRCALALGRWNLDSPEPGASADAVAEETLRWYAAATRHGPGAYKAWHAWALANFEMAARLEQQLGQAGTLGSAAAMAAHAAAPAGGPPSAQAVLLERVRAAALGFFRSIALGRERALQDLLRLLTLWFRHGGCPHVEAVLRDGFGTVDVDMWLLVGPQLIARIAAPNARVSALVHALLLRVGAAHPQALIYPLAVAAHDRGSTAVATPHAQQPPPSQRRVQAEAVLAQMRAGYDRLVEQALLVADELVRVAILWAEQWQDALDEGYRCGAAALAPRRGLAARRPGARAPVVDGGRAPGGRAGGRAGWLAGGWLAGWLARVSSARAPCSPPTRVAPSPAPNPPWPRSPPLAPPLGARAAPTLASGATSRTCSRSSGPCTRSSTAAPPPSRRRPSRRRTGRRSAPRASAATPTCARARRRSCGSRGSDTTRRSGSSARSSPTSRPSTSASPRRGSSRRATSSWRCRAPTAPAAPSSRSPPSSRRCT
jgi:hypothetical protein